MPKKAVCLSLHALPVGTVRAFRPVMYRTFGRLGLGALLMVLVSPHAASADQISWTGTGSGAWATFSLAGDPIGTPFSDFVGELTWNWVGSPPAGSATSLFTYCVDATQYLTDQQTVAVSSTTALTGASQSNPSVTANGGVDAGGRIAWLFNQYSTEAHGDASGIDAAALQIAIWETLYDSTPDLNSGAFELVDNPAYGDYDAIYGKATADLTALYSNPLPGGGDTYYTSQATFLDTAVGQDQVTGSPVPEPSSLVLFGSCVFAAIARRRKAAGRA
jgi:hypothetical protein